MTPKTKPTLLIPVLTFVFGILTFSLFALQTNSFWFYSSVDIPILKLPTLYIGDTLFIPLFNYYLFDLYKKTKAQINYKKYSTSFKIFVILALIISLTINYFQHIEWTKDQYTGFIDVKLNMLSPVGWWHMIFASLEMTIMLLLLWIFTIILLEKNVTGFKRSKRLFWIFFIYSSFSILDFIIKERYVVNEANLVKAFLNNYLDIKVFYIGVFLLVTYYLISFFIASFQHK